MTNAEVHERYTVVWNGGPLLPEYDSASTLTEACLTPVKRQQSAPVTPRLPMDPALRFRRWTPEKRALVIRQFRRGISPSLICKEWAMSSGTLYGILKDARLTRKATVLNFVSFGRATRGDVSASEHPTGRLRAEATQGGEGHARIGARPPERIAR